MKKSKLIGIPKDNKKTEFEKALKLVELYQEKERDDKEKREFKEREMKVGRCYKYNNSYGSGSRWWLYTKILSVTENGYKILTFEKTSRNRFEIEIKNTWNDGHLIDESTRVKKDVFDKEFNKIKVEVQQLGT